MSEGRLHLAWGAEIPLVLSFLAGPCWENVPSHLCAHQLCHRGQLGISLQWGWGRVKCEDAHLCSTHSRVLPHVCMCLGNFKTKKPGLSVYTGQSCQQEGVHLSTGWLSAGVRTHTREHTHMRTHRYLPPPISHSLYRVGGCSLCAAHSCQDSREPHPRHLLDTRHVQ